MGLGAGLVVYSQLFIAFSVATLRLEIMQGNDIKSDDPNFARYEVIAVLDGGAIGFIPSVGTIVSRKFWSL